MEDKKNVLKQTVFRALAIYAAAEFLWICLVQAWMTSNPDSVISVYAQKLIPNSLVLALFSAALSASFLIFRAKKLSPQAARLLHMAAGYAAAMLCLFFLLDGVQGVRFFDRKGWVVFAVFATIAYFAVYGLSALAVFIVRRKKSR